MEISSTTCLILVLLVIEYVYAQFPAQPGCPILTQPLICPNGYTHDEQGCPICATSGKLPISSNPGGDPLHQGGAQMTMSGSMSSTLVSFSKDFTTPCVMGATCDLKCEYGYVNGPMNSCQYCICATPGTEGYRNPCTDAPITCDLACPEGGYATGADNCQYCSCSSTTVETPTKPTTTSQEECTIKITRCQIRFPFGFMTDDDCDTCIGKDEIYAVGMIPIERQPVIQLSNPCIQGLSKCMIICRTGYRTGPRDCQYCACNN